MRICAIEKDNTQPRSSHEGSTKEKTRIVPIECKAVIHGFKVESKEKDVKTVIEESIKATGMKEENAIDCPAFPITHAFVEFQDEKIRGQVR